MAPMIIILIGVVFGVGFTAASPCGCPCLYTNKLWGDVDPTKYNFCDPATNTSAELSCPTGRGFIANGTYSGCVPFSEWSESCITQVANPPVCACNNVHQPTVSSYPNKFYLCPSEGATPVLLQCESGKGFISNGEYLGCLDWADWRQSKGCYTF